MIAPGTQRHAVKFYENEASLCTTVADFLAGGLAEGYPGIIIATDPHVRGILGRLGTKIDIPRALDTGRVLVLNADELLPRIMVDERPDIEAFDRHIGAVVSDMAARHESRSTVRAYGELVDVLWRQGRHDAAIKLELLWNQLATRCAFDLLCGYAMGSFYKEPERLEHVCAQHTHVVPYRASL